MAHTYDYDVALSFAGEDREVVERIATILTDHGLRVFYDRFETAQLLGKNLYDHFSQLFESRARFCVIFLSKHYAGKPWTRLEHHAAQERAFREQEEYILPVRIDDTVLPGLGQTVGYLDLRTTTAEEVARIIIAKVRAPSAELCRASERWRANGFSLEWVLTEPEVRLLTHLQPSYAPHDQFAGFAIASFIRHGYVGEALAWVRCYPGSRFIAEMLVTYAMSTMRRVRYRAAALLSVMPDEIREVAIAQLEAGGDRFRFAGAIRSGDFESTMTADETLSPIIRQQIAAEISTIRRPLPSS